MPAKFLKVKCEACKNEQVIFEKPAMHVKCNICQAVISECTGGRGVVKTRVMGVLK